MTVKKAGQVSMAGDKGNREHVSREMLGGILAAQAEREGLTLDSVVERALRREVFASAFRCASEPIAFFEGDGIVPPSDEPKTRVAYFGAVVRQLLDVMASEVESDEFTQENFDALARALDWSAQCFVVNLLAPKYTEGRA